MGPVAERVQYTLTVRVVHAGLWHTRTSKAHFLLGAFSARGEVSISTNKGPAVQGTQTATEGQVRGRFVYLQKLAHFLS